MPDLSFLGLARTLWLSACLSMGLVGTAAAHEVRPAIADIAVGEETVEITVRLSLEPLLAGIDLTGLENVSDSPLAGQYEALRAETPAEIEATLREAWPGVAEGITLLAGETPLVPEIVSVSTEDQNDLTVARESEVKISATLPDDGTAVQFGWKASYGALAVRQVGGGDQAYTAILQNGNLSEALPRESIYTEGALPVFARFVVSGFEHIIPKGLDHILFVLGLFFFSLQFRSLLWQVTAFTLAHTVTLALASLKIVSIPAAVVEPLIAASIVFVAVENIFGGKTGWTRVAVVFCFGLLHGLGFASVLSDVGLPEGRFVVSLIGFNIGVELGQLAVIAVAFAAFALPFGVEPWYRSRIAIPASVVIAGVGAWWTFERVFL